MTSGEPIQPKHVQTVSSDTWTRWHRSLLAPQSGAHRIAPHIDPNPTHPIQSNPTYSSEARKTHDVIYF